MNYIHKQPVESPLVRAKLLPPSPSPLSLSLYKSDLRERERGEGVGGGRGVTCMYYIYKVMYRKKEEGATPYPTRVIREGDASRVREYLTPTVDDKLVPQTTKAKRERSS